jgi:hypothetical protein
MILLAYGAFAAFAQRPCTPLGNHCYATANQNSYTTAGLNVAIETSYAWVPEDPPDRMQNEAWSQFQPGVTWVEAGATTGYIGGNNPKVQPGYVYFTATSYGYCRCQYYENDFENGPGGNDYFPVDEHYVGATSGISPPEMISLAMRLSRQPRQF